MTRCFLAAVPSCDILNPVVELVQQGRKSFPKLRWVRPENLHVTLAFFGDVDDSRYRILEDALASRLKGLVLSDFSLSQTGSFRRRGTPSILWIQAKSENSVLTKAAQAAEQAGQDVGLPGRERSYHPHLTLARCDDGGTNVLRWLERRWLRPAIKGTARIVLMNSVLMPRGPMYSEKRVFSSNTERRRSMTWL